MTNSPGLKRPLQQDEIDHYREHGVVHLRGLLDLDWVAEAERAFDLVMDVRYLERAGAPPDSAKSPSLQSGDRMDSPEFPLLWTRSKGYVATP
jgi:hypothetical protein